MLPTRMTVWLFVSGLAVYLAAVSLAALVDLFAESIPGLARVPLASAALWLLVGFDACVVVLFLCDAGLAHWTFSIQIRRERPARLSLGAANEVTIVLDNAGPRRCRIVVRDEAPPLFRAEPPLLDATIPGHGWARLTYRLFPT